MFKRLSVLTVLALMGALFLSLVPTAHAQRGGFGGGGFGRGGFGRGGFGRGGIGNGHASGHGGPASVTVVQASGNFFLHFRSGFDGNGFNNFGTSHISPFTGKTVTRFPGVLVHTAPFGFILTDGFAGVPGFNSSLGFPIPPIATTVSSVNPFFFGVRIGPRIGFQHSVFQSVVDLGTISPITQVSIKSVRTSNVTIINLPSNAFRGAHK
ncbi:MAG TPA: hypothetical protein VKN18_19840 [Blastocatellia bacterium]|nr:hypothetical protein [Blastocatellia bacterium]